jgi:hypothetical protein
VDIENELVPTDVSGVDWDSMKVTERSGNAGFETDRWYRRTALVIWNECQTKEILGVDASAHWILGALDTFLRELEPSYLQWFAATRQYMFLFSSEEQDYYVPQAEDDVEEEEEVEELEFMNSDALRQWGHMRAEQALEKNPLKMGLVELLLLAQDLPVLRSFVLLSIQEPLPKAIRSPERQEEYWA